jgi:hypothetical protein
MHRHIIVVTFLEWLNWNNKGFLRVAPDRISWCQIDGAATAFLNSLQFAPDLEPADDGFLIAEIKLPPRNSGDGMLLLSLDSSEFETVSERSSRLLSPAAKRMNVELALATEDIQDAWTLWKERYTDQNADQQARRIWSWAWGRPWPSISHSCHEKILKKTRQSLIEMTALLAENVPLREKVSGTSAEAWMHMVLAAKQGELLASDDAADWRRATNSYITSCVRSGHLAASFILEGDPAFSDAFAALPLSRIEMVELVAVAAGEHHALRLNAGYDPNLGALVADLQNLLNLAAEHQPEEQSVILSIALLAFGRMLPGGAVVALQGKADLRTGWADQLLRRNEKTDLSDRVTVPGLVQSPSGAAPQSIAKRESQDEESAGLGTEVASASVPCDPEAEQQPDDIAPKVTDVPKAVRSDRKLVDDSPGVPKEDKSTKPRSGAKKAKAKASAEKKDELPPFL